MSDCETPPDDKLRQSVGHLILWGTLIAFVSIGTAHGYYTMKRRSRRKAELRTKGDTTDKEVPTEMIRERESGNSLDAYLSGRGNITSWVSLGMSFFSTAMGQWILFFTPYIGYTQGWYGIVGQNVAWILALFTINILAPALQRDMVGHGQLFAITDWIRVRYSREFQIYVRVITCCSLIIFAGAELATMADVFKQHVGNDGSMSTTAIISTCIAVYFYCALNGFASTVFTDTVQCVLILLLALPILFTVFFFDENLSAANTREQGALLATSDVFIASLSTSVSLFFSVMYDFTFWQRMFCADDAHRSLPKKATLLGLTLMCPLLTLLGAFGLMARNTCDSANDPYYILVTKISHFGNGWVVVVLILLVTLVASTLDSFLYAALSMVSEMIARWESKDSPEIVMSEEPERPQPHWQRIKCFALSVLHRNGTEVSENLQQHRYGAWRMLPRPAILCTNLMLFVSAVGVGIMASVTSGYGATQSLTNVFYVANLLAATLVIPTFAGVVLPITNKGALAGAICGLLTPVLYGVIEFNGSLMAGLEMLTLMTFTSSIARHAHESKFAVQNMSAPLLGGQQPLLNATLIGEINNGALSESRLPVFYGDANYVPFLEHFSSAIKPRLKLTTDVPFRPRTVHLFFLVPIVTLVISFVVSKLDSIQSDKTSLEHVTCAQKTTGTNDTVDGGSGLNLLDVTVQRQCIDDQELPSTDTDGDVTFAA